MGIKYTDNNKINFKNIFLGIYFIIREGALLRYKIDIPILF